MFVFSKCCPGCGQIKIRRSSRRNRTEMSVSWTGIRPYRCSSCHTRFFVYTGSRPLLLVVLGGLFLLGLSGTWLGRTRSPVTVPAGDVMEVRAIADARPPENSGKGTAPVKDKGPGAMATDGNPQPEEAEPLPEQGEEKAPLLSVLTAESENAAAGPASGPRDLEAFLHSWVAIWEQGDVARYLALYSPDFIPAGGMNRAAWARQRQQRLTAPDFIEVEIADIFWKARGADEVEVCFKQRYQSDKYQDQVKKTLVVHRTGTGWQIREERSTPWLEGCCSGNRLSGQGAMAEHGTPDRGI